MRVLDRTRMGRLKAKQQVINNILNTTHKQRLLQEMRSTSADFLKPKDSKNKDYWSIFRTIASLWISFSVNWLAPNQLFWLSLNNDRCKNVVWRCRMMSYDVGWCRVMSLKVIGQFLKAWSARWMVVNPSIKVYRLWKSISWRWIWRIRIYRYEFSEFTDIWRHL